MLQKLNTPARLALLIILPVLFFLGTLCIGRYHVAFPDVWNTLLAAGGHSG